METTAYYTFGIPAYGAMLALEALAAHRRGRPTLTFARSVGNVMAGLGAITVGIFIGAVVYSTYDWAYLSFALFEWREDSIATFVVTILLADLGHYWHHRFEHRFALFWAVHGVHHHAEEMNLTVSTRHAWFSDVYSAPFYALMPILGVPPGHFFLATAIMSFHAFITHSCEYDFPSGGFLVTPSTHTLHHAINDRYVDKNFAAMFSIWDRLFGTYAEVHAEEAPIYGSLRGYRTHDGALVQLHLLRELVDAVRATRGWKERIRVLFARPGWPGMGHLAAPKLAPPASDMSPRSKAYVLVQLAVLVAFAVHLFVSRDLQSWTYKVVASLFVVATLVSLGGLLDARPRALDVERVRLCAAILLGLLLIRPYALDLRFGAVHEGVLGVFWIVCGVLGLFGLDVFKSIKVSDLGSFDEGRRT